MESQDLKKDVQHFMDGVIEKHAQEMGEKTRVNNELLEKNRQQAIVIKDCEKTIEVKQKFIEDKGHEIQRLNLVVERLVREKDSLRRKQKKKICRIKKLLDSEDEGGDESEAGLPQSPVPISERPLAVGPIDPRFHKSNSVRMSNDESPAPDADGLVWDEIPVPSCSSTIAAVEAAAVAKWGKSGGQPIKCYNCSTLVMERSLVNSLLCNECRIWEHNSCVSEMLYSNKTNSKECFFCLRLKEKTGKEEIKVEKNLSKRRKGEKVEEVETKSEDVPAGDPSKDFTYYWNLFHKETNIMIGSCVYLTRTEDYMSSDMSGDKLDPFRVQLLIRDKNQKPWIWGNHFYAPQEIKRRKGQKFFPNERFVVFECNGYAPLSEVAGVCCCLMPNDWREGKPRGVPDKDIYIVEAAYSTKTTMQRVIKQGSSDYRLCKQPFAFKRYPKKIKTPDKVEFEFIVSGEKTVRKMEDEGDETVDAKALQKDKAGVEDRTEKSNEGKKKDVEEKKNTEKMENKEEKEDKIELEDKRRNEMEEEIVFICEKRISNEEESPSKRVKIESATEMI